MTPTLTATTRRRLDIQGFDTISTATLAKVAPWFRLAFGLCTVIAGIGTALASPIVVWALVPIAALGAIVPVHPFDLIYNVGIRYLRGTGPLGTGIAVPPSARMTFIARCSARACCIATRESPSSTKPGTRISIAKKS